MVQQPRALRIRLDLDPVVEIVMDIDSIRALSISSGQEEKCTVVITLTIAPRIYERMEENLVATLDLFGPGRTITCFRETKLPGCEQSTIGSCLAYRLTAGNASIHPTTFKQHLQNLTAFRVRILSTIGLSKWFTPAKFESDVASLDACLKQMSWPFALSYQVQKLWANALLSPNDIQTLLADMAALRTRAGDKVLISVLRRLCQQLQVADVHASGLEEAQLIVRQQESFLQHEGQITHQRQGRDEVSVHSVIVTPTGLYLYGPEEMAANRVLRQHRTNQDCFLRVSFTDENADRIEFDRDCSNERILRGRFLSILQQGLDIAGEHFDFLGFSHSSLRSQSCWFMRPFLHEGQLLNARSLILSLGDFSSIRCPAKCAARIGQAFSETTSAVQLDPSIVHPLLDIRAGKYIFTDGCGTISKQTWKLLKGSHSSKDQPTLYQIRYKGRFLDCSF